MSHPMETVMEARRTERDRLWQRRNALERRLKPVPLSRFTFEQFADLQLLADRSAPAERARDLEQALDRLETFLDAKKKPRRQARAARKRR